MHKRKSEKEWLELVEEYTTSGLNLTAWCKKNNICKSSIYPYLKKLKRQLLKHQNKSGES